MTDEQIIQWLMANKEEFATSTEPMQQAMITGWQETLDAMHGVQQTNWEEVQLQQQLLGQEEKERRFLHFCSGRSIILQQS